MKRYLARNHKFYIYDVNKWLQVSGIANWSLAYATETAELAKFSSNGWGGSIVTSLSGVVTLEGFYLADASGLRDSGQKACETAAAGLGYYALRGFKIEAYDDAGAQVGNILGSGIFSFSNRGGATTAVMRWDMQMAYKGIPLGSGIYNIFSQEAYPAPAPDISRSGMWTGVLGMYTYAE